MQNAQDTFYIALRDRLTTINPNRTISLRGSTRPGILVEGNEIVMAQAPSDVFVLRWTGLSIHRLLPSVMLQMQCEITYMTEGTMANLGLDRHAMLTRMDTELASILDPPNAPKESYVQVPATPMETRIFWSEPTFQPMETERDRLSRTVSVFVFSYEEPGEL